MVLFSDINIIFITQCSVGFCVEHIYQIKIYLSAQLWCFYRAESRKMESQKPKKLQQRRTQKRSTGLFAAFPSKNSFSHISILADQFCFSVFLFLHLLNGTESDLSSAPEHLSALFLSVTPAHVSVRAVRRCVYSGLDYSFVLLAAQITHSLLA